MSRSFFAKVSSDKKDNIKVIKSCKKKDAKKKRKKGSTIVSKRNKYEKRYIEGFTSLDILKMNKQEKIEDIDLFFKKRAKIKALRRRTKEIQKASLSLEKTQTKKNKLLKIASPILEKDHVLKEKLTEDLSLNYIKKVLKSNSLELLKLEEATTPKERKKRKKASNIENINQENLNIKYKRFFKRLKKWFRRLPKKILYIKKKFIKAIGG